MPQSTNAYIPGERTTGIRVLLSITRTGETLVQNAVAVYYLATKGRRICADKPRFNFAAIPTGRQRLILFYIVVSFGRSPV
ncbi:hypothetical protein TcasGA2_TC003107 [Tribolium castaneum]|uniref:Uncharacterized protein n=1 Tax=Tribolium castaneum TaxID=7070 RepID=D6WFB5_TRICA|nr:hypothetical protein TcasGA2_TC003107 [Tribolium castaneum]